MSLSILEIIDWIFALGDMSHIMACVLTCVTVWRNKYEGYPTATMAARIG